MKKQIKKIILNIHLWLGLLTGLVIFIEGITGAIYVFSLEISESAYKDKYTLSSSAVTVEPLPLSQLTVKARELIEEDVPLLRIYRRNTSESTVAFVFQKLDPDALFYNSYMQFFKTVYLNPYSGEVVEIENTKWEFFNVIMWMHMTLLMSYDLGGAIVAWAVLGFVVMMISGLILWWPKNKKSRKMRFWFTWKTGFSGKRKVFDLHTVLGFYILSFGLIISITGLFWSFQSLNQGVKWIADGGKVIERPLPKVPDTVELSNQEPLDKVYQHMRVQSPNADSYVIKMPRKPEYPFVGRAYFSHATFYDRAVYYADSKTGHLLRKDEMDDLTNAEKVVGINYDIHVGSIGGLSTKVLAFITCLIISSLPITGFIIWRNKSYRV
ncbi:PepSY-associated TM helix domain-containing protein [Flammeovirgaceae bacterium SG7u.111]|nr:PepSY-associated TM helix domain-containing protein [Flammeovirgaceae bacterium SG7u.132]WPO33393.1 PepSY-associated TM helix domain-containing protein [Flammeovirgaceae bacterium SG7u.111]